MLMIIECGLWEMRDESPRGYPEGHLCAGVFGVQGVCPKACNIAFMNIADIVDEKEMVDTFDEIYRRSNNECTYHSCITLQ